MIIVNNSYSVDPRNKNIFNRDLELSFKDRHYARSYLFTFILLKESQKFFLELG